MHNPKLYQQRHTTEPTKRNSGETKLTPLLGLIENPSSLNCYLRKSSLTLQKECDMSTIELRHVITEYLTHIDDASFLNAIKTIIESKVSEGTYMLSDFQKKRIEEGREQVRKGQTISNESLKQEIDQWLSTK